MVKKNPDEDVKKKIISLEKRVTKLETAIKVFQEQDSVQEEDVQKEIQSTDKFVPGPSISFQQVITVLGIIGVVIGLLSFFFYAIANQWIGETAQILLGMTFGLGLFAVSYYVKEKNQQWSTIVFGGALFVELLSIGIGVNVYQIMPPIIGLVFSALFILATLVLSVTYASRAISYFGLIGGYILPFIVGYGDNDLFILSLNVLLTLGLIVISYKKEWADLRFVSFIIMMFFIISYIPKFMSAQNAIIPIMYLIVVGLLFHLATVVGMLKFRTNLAATDAVISAILPIIIFANLYALLTISLPLFGLLILCYAIVKLLEIALIKQKVSKLPQSIVYTFLSTGFVILNLGLIFMLTEIRFTYFIVLFAIQQMLFMFLAQKVKEKLLYRVFSYIFLGLTAIWTLIIIVLSANSYYFSLSFAESSIMLIILGAILTGFYVQFKKGMDYMVMAGSFIIYGYLFILNIAQYIQILSESEEVMHITLSILWLAYTLFMYTQVKTQPGKILTGVLLGITLCKIAFNDLLFLDGVFRIVGFILFGILLLIGGFFMGGKK